MLKVRFDQAEFIARRHFVEQAMQHMRRNHADFAALGPDITRPFVETTLEEATTKYGLHEQRAAMTFLLTAWFLGPDFAERHPGAQILLRDNSRSERERGSLLYRWAWKQMGEEPA